MLKNISFKEPEKYLVRDLGEMVEQELSSDLLIKP